MDMFEYIKQNCNDEFHVYSIAEDEVGDGAVLFGLPNREDSVKIQSNFFGTGCGFGYDDEDPYLGCAGSNIKGILFLEADQVITIEDTKTMLFQDFDSDSCTLEGTIIGKVIQKEEFGYVVSVEEFPYPIGIEDDTTNFAVNNLIKASGELILCPYRSWYKSQK